MKRLLNIKILILFIIICVGTYALTQSFAITAGVVILMFVADKLVGAWADKKDSQYFYKDMDSDDSNKSGCSDNANDKVNQDK